MKDETNNEMDLLLRRFGRRDDETMPNADHLDADELSAYAENALPAPARAQYTAHLADCSRCRELAVRLCSSTGEIAVSETTKVVVPSGWKAFLANIFSPMVLRYAVPALGLIVVTAIGIVVMRREQSGNDVTQVTNNEQSRPASTRPEAGNAETHQYYSVPTPSISSGVKTQPPNSPPSVSVEAEASKDVAEVQAKPDQKTVAANEPPPPAATATAPEESPKVSDAEVNKKEVRGVSAAKPGSESASQERAQREDKGDFAAAPATGTGPVDNASAQGARSIAQLKRDELSGTTRSIAGRRFQKKGGIWIDTAYNSSSDITTLTRGSEQYRALVADEPSIKIIADELDGEIIVVWKGRTYRIR